MICFPNCKINPGLFIIEKRQDGYHNIETLFCPVPLCDVLEVVEGDKNEFTISGIAVPGGSESNLVIKAYEMLKKRYDLPCVKIHLHKVIPTGAGLGGGSSNAAFMIKLLDEVFSLQMSKEQMRDVAGMLGSDCSFFIENKSVFATGRGDVFENVGIDLSNYFLLLVKPAVHISTPYAYSLVEPRPAPFDLRKIDVTKISEWRNYVENDFEKPVFAIYPELKGIKEKLYELGAVYAAMSGSGSALYGIFKEEVDLKGLFDGCFVWQGKL
jgi:4-diphosphocytidyl-2-C-methyl-D-erythritol kinase